MYIFGDHRNMYAKISRQNIRAITDGQYCLKLSPLSLENILGGNDNFVFGRLFRKKAA
jgi:hypothetical protein